MINLFSLPVITMAFLILALSGCTGSNLNETKAQPSVANSSSVRIVGSASQKENTVQSSVGKSSSLRTVVNADIDYAQDEKDLVQKATLVIVGVPTGQIEEAPVLDGAGNSDEVFVNYYQTVQVLEVLKGQDPGNTVRLVGSGISTKAKVQGATTETQQLQGKRVAVLEKLRGALSPGKQILFLEPSAKPGVLQVVGYTSGEMPLNPAGRVIPGRPEAKAFENLDVPGAKRKIEELSTSQ